jgi:hypothetical protein
MPVYDIQLFNDETNRHVADRQDARREDLAWERARKKARPECYGADGELLDGYSPQRIVSCKRLSETEGKAWRRECARIAAAAAVLSGRLPKTHRKKRASRAGGGEYQSTLLRAALAKSDRGGIQEDVEWVYQNLGVPWKDIPVHSVPSPGAVTLLVEAKRDKKWFLEKYHAKLLPNKSQRDDASWFEADDGQVAEMAARVREEMLMAEAEA